MSESIALGFCNNVDYEIAWNSAVFEELVIHYQVAESDLNGRMVIASERDLTTSILGFMRDGEGGERFVSHSALIERFAARFKKKVTLGGTAVRAAIAMRKLGHTATLHLITQNDHVRRLLPSDCVHVCSNDKDSVHPHLIVQFSAGDRVCAGEIDIRASKPNRLIYHCNADRIEMRLSPEFADRITEARVLLISGFNAMQNRGLLEDRLATISRMLARLPCGAKVFLEDGGYFDPQFRQVVYRTLGPRITIYSMNEDEMQDHLQRRVALCDVGQVRKALDDLHRFIPAAVIVVHTRYWALAHGDGASAYAEALKAGVTLATTRFRFGDDFTVGNYSEIERRAPSDENAEFASAINSLAGDAFYCVPVPEVEQAKATTIGLGDAFVGGFLPALVS